MASGYMFSHYFPGDGAVGEVPVTNNTYPQWQSSVIMGMGLIPFMPLSPYFWFKLKFIFKFIKLLFSDDLERALGIVKKVAHTPGMNNGQSWGAIGQYMGKQPGVGENVYRHLLACKEWGPEVNYGHREMRDLTLQLAYCLYKKGKI